MPMHIAEVRSLCEEGLQLLRQRDMTMMTIAAPAFQCTRCGLPERSTPARVLEAVSPDPTTISQQNASMQNGLRAKKIRTVTEDFVETSEVRCLRAHPPFWRFEPARTKHQLS